MQAERSLPGSNENANGPTDSVFGARKTVRPRARIVKCPVVQARPKCVLDEEANKRQLAGSRVTKRAAMGHEVEGRGDGASHSLLFTHLCTLAVACN